MTQAEIRLDLAIAERQIADDRYKEACRALDEANGAKWAALDAWDVAHKEFLAADAALCREDNDALSR